MASCNTILKCFFARFRCFLLSILNVFRIYLQNTRLLCYQVFIMSQRPGSFFFCFAYFAFLRWAVVFARPCFSRCFLSQQSWKHRFFSVPWDLHNFSLKRNLYDIRNELAASILSVCPSLDLKDSRWLADVWYFKPCDKASILQV